jgi:hypothetical protein
MGIGEKKTPRPFVNACDVFVYTENLVPQQKITRQPTQRSRNTKKKEEPEAMTLIRQAFEMAVQEDGWARLDHVGNALYQLDPGFDPRTYGHRQLSRLIANYKNFFEMRTQEIDGSTLFYIKLKE